MRRNSSATTMVMPIPADSLMFGSSTASFDAHSPKLNDSARDTIHHHNNNRSVSFAAKTGGSPTSMFPPRSPDYTLFPIEDVSSPELPEPQSTPILHQVEQQHLSCSRCGRAVVLPVDPFSLSSSFSGINGGPTSPAAGTNTVPLVTQKPLENQASSSLLPFTPLPLNPNVVVSTPTRQCTSNAEFIPTTTTCASSVAPPIAVKQALAHTPTSPSDGNFPQHLGTPCGLGGRRFRGRHILPGAAGTVQGNMYRCSCGTLVNVSSALNLLHSPGLTDSIHLASPAVSSTIQSGKPSPNHGEDSESGEDRDFARDHQQLQRRLSNNTVNALATNLRPSQEYLFEMDDD